MKQKVKKSSLTRQLLQERGINDYQGVQHLVKELTRYLIRKALDAELETEFGYSKYDYKHKITDNTTDNTTVATGCGKKTLHSSREEIEIQTPRDRDAEFEPQLVKKYHTDISSI